MRTLGQVILGSVAVYLAIQVADALLEPRCVCVRTKRRPYVLRF